MQFARQRGEKLQRHYTQAFEYWLQLVPERPRYVVLSNFDEFWIYDFDSQLNDPVDTVPLGALVERYTALNFLFPVEKKPRFGNDRVAVTRVRWSAPRCRAAAARLISSR